MDLINNEVILKGKMVEEPQYHHTTGDIDFYEMKLSVKRPSDKDDIIPVLVNSELASAIMEMESEFLQITGQYRSYNWNDGKSHLLLFVFAYKVAPVNSINDDPNSVINLHGFICKKPVFRVTPKGREIVDFMFAVNRAYGKSDYIPCIAWEQNANVIKDLPVGMELWLTGHIESRDYNKKISETEVEKRVAYEVSISSFDTSREEIVADIA